MNRESAGSCVLNNSQLGNSEALPELTLGPFDHGLVGAFVVFKFHQEDSHHITPVKWAIDRKPFSGQVGA